RKNERGDVGGFFIAGLLPSLGVVGITATIVVDQVTVTCGFTPEKISEFIGQLCSDGYSFPADGIANGSENGRKKTSDIFYIRDCCSGSGYAIIVLADLIIDKALRVAGRGIESAPPVGQISKGRITFQSEKPASNR